MKTAFVLLALSAITLFSCQTKSAVDTSITQISRGTSFGHCVGYCNHETTASSKTLVHKSTSRDEAANPQKVVQENLSDADWKKLTSAVSIAEFEKMPATIGCPDCADGGAEWIEIQQGNKVQRVTFEFGKSPQELQKIVALLKAKEKK
jgi:hypothetical protein